MIYILRTTVGRENAVMTALTSKRLDPALKVKSIFHPDELKGYIFIEGDPDSIEEFVKNTPHIRGIIKKDVVLKDVVKFFETKKIDIKLNRGDIVEVVAGPFKNEKGKVTRVDESKEEVTLELLEAAVPIPITVSLSVIKLIESEKKGD